MPKDDMSRSETRDVKGMMEGDRGDAKAQPSGPRDNSSTAGEGERRKEGQTAREAEINPSAPGETGTTPGTNG